MQVIISLSFSLSAAFSLSRSRVSSFFISLSLVFFYLSSLQHSCEIESFMRLLSFCLNNYFESIWFYLNGFTCSTCLLTLLTLYREGTIIQGTQGGLCDGLPLVSEWRICLFGFLFFVHSFFCPFLCFFHLSFSIFGLFFRYLFATRLLIRFSCLHFNCQLWINPIEVLL